MWKSYEVKVILSSSLSLDSCSLLKNLPFEVELFNMLGEPVVFL